MRLWRIIIRTYFVCQIFLAGCSPFDSSSVIDIQTIGDAISDIFSAKTTVDINAGGSQNLISAPTSGLPSDVHTVTVSVANVYQQNTFVTPQGHTVEVMISGVSQ
jgi:hypothetical protein